jgi:ribonuclease HI
MEVKNWNYPANHVKIIEAPEDSPQYIQAYTDGSKSEAGVRSGIAIFSGNNLKTTLKYRLHRHCSNNQAEQMAILRALEYIQFSNVEEKTVLVYTDSRITLQMLKKKQQKKQTHLIEQIRSKVFELEQDEWKVECSWIKAHAGHRGNELADQLAKEAASSRTIDKCYTRFPKSAVLGDLNEQSVNQWQKERERSSKGAVTKSFFPEITDRLKLKINATPKFTAIVTGHGNIKTYLFKYRIIERPRCSCEEGEQSVDHIIYDCKLLEQEKTRLKAVVTRSEKWPVSRDKLSIKFYRYFKEFTDRITLDKV